MNKILILQTSWYSNYINEMMKISCKVLSEHNNIIGIKEAIGSEERINELSNSEYHEDDRIEERKKISCNLRLAESFGPILLMLLYIFFCLINFV